MILLWNVAHCEASQVHLTIFNRYPRFIKPAELLSKLAGNGLENRDLTGLKSRVNPIWAIRILRARKRGEISYSEAMRRLDLRESRDVGVLYAGYARKQA